MIKAAHLVPKKVVKGISTSTEYLRCPEQLNPEEQQTTLTSSATIVSQNSIASDVIERRSEKGPTLQLCMNLPATQSSRKNFLSKQTTLKLKDSSSFGNPRNHGLPYLKSEREIRITSTTPSEAVERLKISNLLKLSEHLVVSSGGKEHEHHPTEHVATSFSQQTY